MISSEGNSDVEKASETLCRTLRFVKGVGLESCLVPDQLLFPASPFCCVPRRLMGVARGPRRQTLLPSGFRLSVLTQWRSPAEGRQRGDEIRVWFSLASLCNPAHLSWPAASLSFLRRLHPHVLSWEHLPPSPAPG